MPAPHTHTENKNYIKKKIRISKKIIRCLPVPDVITLFRQITHFVRINIFCFLISCFSLHKTNKTH